MALVLVTYPAAGIGRARYIDSGCTFFDIRNLSLLVDNEGGAVGYASLGHQHAVRLRGLPRGEIAEEREGQGKFLCKFTLGRTIISANSEYLRISTFKFGDTSLVSREFLRSTTGERSGKECHHHVLLASIIGELDLLALSRWQFEIGSRVADLEVCFRRGLRRQDASQGGGEYCQTKSLHTRRA